MALPRLSFLHALAGWRQTEVRFLIVGAVNTAFGLAAYPVLYLLLAPAWHYLVILPICQVINATFAFLTTKFFVFRTEGRVAFEFLKFGFFHVLVFSINFFALPAIMIVSGLGPVLGQTFFNVLVIATSFFWHSRVTFSTAKESRP